MGRYFSALLIFLACCPPAQPVLFEQYQFNGKAIPFYTNSSNREHQELIEWAKSQQLAESMVNVVNSALMIKGDIGVGFEHCGNGIAFFSAQRRAIVLCTELFATVVRLANDDKEFMMKLPQDQRGKIVVGLLFGIYLHELAHALISLNRVPITGREEDVADQFSLWFAVNFMDPKAAPIVLSTVWFWRGMANARNIPSMSHDQLKQFLANEHSLDEQRIYNVACWYLGTNSMGRADIARFAGLTQQRAERCPNEYAAVDRGMRSQFKQYIKVRPTSGRW